MSTDCDTKCKYCHGCWLDMPFSYTGTESEKCSNLQIQARYMSKIIF